MKITKAAAYALHALMFMVRHATQLPVTAEVIAKGEGLPLGYLAKIFQRLVKARLVRAVKGRKRGYVFAKPPEEISLLELFETVEGGPLFDDCLLKHCECSGTPDNCHIYAKWLASTGKIKQLLSETSVADAAWNHPEHRFYSLPESLEPRKNKPRKNAVKEQPGIP
ncbi:MAG: Rrf2 family transcriptional regulator [Phycisphaerales bacterium]|nr:MAG: Rrf2 family transcriptional regulator [Phycisphaerales bacterium]